MGNLVRFNLFVLLALLTTTASAQEACKSAYAQAQNACVAESTEMQRDTQKINQKIMMNDPLATSLGTVQTMRANRSPLICQNYLDVCLKACDKGTPSFKDCHDGKLRQGLHQLEAQVKSGEGSLIVGNGESSSGSGSQGVRFKGGVGLPSTLDAPSKNPSASSYDNYMESQTNKPDGLHIGITIGGSGKKPSNTDK